MIGTTATHRFVHRRLRLCYRIAIALMIGFGLFVPGKIAHAGNPVQVTVTIMRFKELQDPEGTFEHSHGEYYGYVTIDGQAIDGRNLGYGEAQNAPDISPYWRFTATVDSSHGPNIPVFIQVRDDDTGVPFSTDDLMDINPHNCDRELHLSFNLNDGTWMDTDNSIANTGWSKGNGDTGCFGDGGEQGEVLYDVGFGNDNLSGDGIPDGIKRFGVRDIDSGNLVADMAALGADPCRKTVAVWVDYMTGATDGHTHKPTQGAIDLAQNMYNNAPVPAVSPCPYPGFPAQNSGMKLILDVQKSVPETPTMVPDDANFTTDKQTDFPAALNPYFFYLIMVHDQVASGSPRTVTDAATTGGSPILTSSSAAWSAADVGSVVSGAGLPGPSIASPSGTTIAGLGPSPNTVILSTAAPATATGSSVTITPHTSSSGLSCPANSHDYVVSLGSWSNETGTASDQGSSIVHELGHCLGLGHGGGDGTNCKPNYLSVMNYDFQTTGIPSATGGSPRFDYSSQALPTLNESALIEKNGVGGDGKDLTVWTPDNGKTEISGSTSGALDWDNNGDGGNNTNPESVDINALSSGGCGPVGTSPNPSPGQTLTGYDDWNNLQYRAPLSPTASGSGVTHPGHEDITYAEANQQKAFWATTFLTTTAGPALSGVEGTALPLSTLATATDSEPSSTGADFTPLIDWGDGNQSTGSIAGPTGGPFTVTGSHTYTEEGSFTVTVTLRDQGGAFSRVTTGATIGDAPLASNGTTIVTLNPFSGTVATFTDADPGGLPSDYTASIAWGDGTTTPGAVVANGSGFAVTGSHSFVALGPETATITISDAGGSTTSTTSSIIVFAFPPHGAFVVGDNSTATAGGGPVTWWSANWSTLNSLSGGPAPDAFKGFADTTSSTPPVCGGMWASGAGASSRPTAPGDIPSYMGVVVSSTIAKSGSTITGNIPKIVVVKSASGYNSNPGHPGTGTIVATYCP